MSKGPYLIEITIRVICDTALNQRTFQEIQTALELSLPRPKDGLISSVSWNCTPLEVLH